MIISSRHTNKRIYVLLLLIVAMLVGMYVVNFKKITTSSQAAPPPNAECVTKSGDPTAYCEGIPGIRVCRSGYKTTSYTCNLGISSCCISTGGTGLGGSNLDVVCRRKSGKPAAYCNGFNSTCGPGFTKQGSCGLAFSCCVPDAVPAAPTAVPRPQGTTDADCGTAHIECRRYPATPKCKNISLTASAIYRCVPQDFRTSPTPRPTAGTIAPNNVCPPPVGSDSNKTCQTQGYRWGPTQNGAKTCYSICGNLYSSYCGNAKLIDANGNNNVTPCCGEALSKPFLFSKVCCDKLNPDDIKRLVFGGDESKARQNCPNLP